MMTRDRRDDAGNIYSFSLKKESAQQDLLSIAIPSRYVKALYSFVVSAQQMRTMPFGFSQGTTPLHYIETNFRTNIIEHLKSLLFTHCVINFLSRSLISNRIIVAGEPTLVDIEMTPESGAEFLFSVTTVDWERNERWKRAQFAPPKRKNYKDIDRQVALFIEDETRLKEAHEHDAIGIGDLVYFHLTLVDAHGQSLVQDHAEELWLKMSDEEADMELRDLFIGKRVNDEVIVSDCALLQLYINNDLDVAYRFKIVIKAFVPHAYFSFDLFRKHFKIRSQKEMQSRFVEVFSFRNDVSLRRQTVETLLRALVKTYYISLPHAIFEKQRKTVLHSIHNNPDYLIYKARNDFQQKIQLLAEKQVKERIIIDAIAYQENIKVSDADVLAYMGLLQRTRTKGFIYFSFSSTKLHGHEVPISQDIVKQQCLREKTLNYVLNYIHDMHK